MGRRDHLIRIALLASQSQIQEPVTPTSSDDGYDEEAEAVALKNEKIQRFEAAQGAVLSAIGLLTEERKKETETGFQDLPLVAAACQFVNYALSLPLLCQRNQILALRTQDPSYFSLLRGSWRMAGWSLFWIGDPSMLVYQFGYSVSMHYLQPRIVHKFRKLYSPASGKSINAICMRLGVSMTVNLATWFILYPFWRHAILQSLFWVPYWELFPPRSAFFPRHNWNSFMLSYFYHFGFWLLQINTLRNFKQEFYPTPDKRVTDREGTYPDALSTAVSDSLPMLLGLGVETILLRSIARDFGPPGFVLNTLELGNVGLMVKALAAEWAVEWVWLEVQYWANEAWYWYKGYQE